MMSGLWQREARNNPWYHFCPNIFTETVSEQFPEKGMAEYC
jgi:hypothetical protein